MEMDQNQLPEDYQHIEVSIKREQYVAFWINTVTVLNKSTSQKRKFVFCDEKKLTESEVYAIMKKLGLDLSCLSYADWIDDKKWNYSAYENPNRDRIKALTIKEDGTVKPIATCKVRRQDGCNIGYIQVLCGLTMKSYQDPLPIVTFGQMNPENWIEGFNAWTSKLPTFKSLDGYNAWMKEYCELGSLVTKIKYYYEGLIQGEGTLVDSDIEQEVLGLELSLNYHLVNYNKDKEKHYTEYPNYYDRCDYYISELSKNSSKVMEFFEEYENRDHPAFDRMPSCDEIWDILRTYEAYEKAKKVAPQYFTDEYIAEHFKK